jgi:hypothetical protein
MVAGQAFFDQLYREQVLQARSMTPEQRVLEGLRLSDMAMRAMADGIRAEFPNADECEVLGILRERLERIRRAQELR